MSRNNLRWNYRIGTKKVLEQRLFSVIRVYYKDKEIDSYSELNGPISDWDSVREIKKTLKRIKKAFKKPILDTDNWPKKYIPGSDIQVTNDLYSQYDTRYKMLGSYSSFL